MIPIDLQESAVSMIKNLLELHEQLDRLSKLIIAIHLPEEDRPDRYPSPKFDEETRAGVYIKEIEKADLEIQDNSDLP
ncbi:MAG: hypothetical protein HZA02_00215 [Nitrospinae bacterium]|nr:hypothetical protein [Nitrospinota bacterium]